MSPLALLKIAALSGALLTLVACQDDRARADEHYQSALALIAEGDTVRADLEFRNVFQADGTHLEARETYAAMLRETGDLDHSYSQYLRLVEQDPENIAGRIALAEMALGLQNWEEVRWHGQRAMELAPDAPETAIIAVNLDYIDAIEAEDDVARRAAADAARAQLEADPDNSLIQRLIVDSLVRDRDFDAALVAIDSALATDPGANARALYNSRLQILGALEDAEAIEAQLREMMALFPEDPELPAVLLRFYVARDDIEGARTLLTDLAETTESADTREEAQVALVRLQLEHEGLDAAMAELDRIIAVDADAAGPFHALRAGLRFDAGDRDGAIAEIEALLDGDLSGSERGRYQTALARMLLEDGNLVGAQRLVDTVLEADPNQTDALKMRAAWLIEGDDTDRAIQNLRTVLDDDPEDTVALTLMAQAYARSGNRELAREFLSLAMQASGGAPQETLRYANVLFEEERYLLAEEALIAALRLTPNQPDILTALGRVYLQLSDWRRAEDVERMLRALNTEATLATADRLRAAVLVGRGQVTQAMEMLETAAADNRSDVSAQAAVVQGRLTTGDPEGALAYAESLVADAPDNLGFRLLLATVHVARGQMAEAEAEFRAVTEADPQIQPAWLGLISAQNAQDRRDEARATLDAALAVHPDAPDLLWAQAGYLEQAGDIDGAVALYEQLYEIAPNSPIVANNLASLISTYREDAESLNRAYAIARRLRGTEVAPFADTYGWIAYRRGEYEEALGYLELAAEGLPENPLVQYHLGMTYLALERPDAALEQLQRALDLAGPDDTRAQFAAAREEIAALQALQAQEPETEAAPEQ